MKPILAALLRSLTEAVDSKRALAAVTGAVASSLVLLAGHQNWSWLDVATADKIAGVIVVKGAALVAAYTFRDPSAPAPVPATTTTSGGAVVLVPSKN